jgi:tRNA pseudouridine55 synthase
MTSGILILNKPPGPSSAAILGPVKRAMSTKKVGHSGTLDPFASGVMIVLVGRATRTARWFTALPKTYRALVQFGSATDTLDREGTVIRTGSIPRDEDVQAALAAFHGTISQVPPDFSAVRVQGKRAYTLARAGENVTIPPRQVEIRDLTMQPHSDGLWHMEVACGSGTYIRSLARDIAASLQTVAHLRELERTSVGSFTLQDSCTPDQLREHDAPTMLLRDAGQELRRLGSFQEVFVPREMERSLLLGQPLNDRISPADREGLVLAVTAAGIPLAVLRWDGGQWRYELVLTPGATAV